MELRISFQSLVIIQYLLLQIKAEEKLHWNSNSKDVNLIAPDYLPESKKENRRLAVIVPWDKKEITLSCTMEGFEGDETSKPKWTTDFQDTQITKSNITIREPKIAFWDVTIVVSSNDSGIRKVSCNYQQGFFAKVIEVEFDIYVPHISPEDKKDSSNEVQCPENVDVYIKQGEADPGPIPYDKIAEDVKKQIKKIFPTSTSNMNIQEYGNNTFSATVILNELKEVNPNLYVDVCPEPQPQPEPTSGGSSGLGVLVFFVVLIILVLGVGAGILGLRKYRPDKYTALKDNLPVKCKK